MKLLPSANFLRTSKKLAKKNPQHAEGLKNALRLLETDLYHPRLKTHNLRGKLEGSLACSTGYDLRIIRYCFGRW